jgi:S1-C subfamily serine protease
VFKLAGKDAVMTPPDELPEEVQPELPGWTPPAMSWEPPPPPPPPRPRRSPLAVAIAAALVVVVALGGGIGIGWTLARVLVGQQASLLPRVGGGTSGGAVAPPSSQTDQGQAATGSLSQAEAAVVDINTTVSGGEAAGSGMVLTSGGEVLTNNHVVDGATSISVTVPSTGRSYDAHVLGVDPSADVALIQLSGASGLKTVKIAPASAVKVGVAVVAIGNALGQGGAPSVTQGAITALDESITASEDNGTSEQLTGLIESDAPISPGDSGGALVDTSGRVLGMITAGQTRGFRSSSSDVGYAVPAATAMSVVQQIRSGHSSAQVIIGSSGYIGVQVRDGDSGVQVVGIEPGSPAEQAGITSGSTITAINGTSVSDSQTMGNLIHAHKPGDQITVGWIDANGDSHTATVTLESGPPV